MDLGIWGKWVVVNGVSVGLGWVSVLVLVWEGVDLVLLARGEEWLWVTCTEIVVEIGVCVILVVVDHSTIDGRVCVFEVCLDFDIFVMMCSLF